MNKIGKYAIQMVLYALTLLACAGILLFAVRRGASMPLGVACLGLSVLLAGVLHEGGHILAGSLLGMRLVSVTLFCLKITLNQRGKAEVEWVNPFLSDALGATCMYPESPENMKRRFLGYSIGGVAANAAWAVITLVLCLIFRRNGYVWATLGMTLPYTVYLILVNGLPVFDEGRYDGALFFGLLKDEPAQLAMTHILTIQGYMAEGRAPAEIDVDLYFDLPQLREDDETFGLLHLFRYYYLMDSGQEQRAFSAVSRLEDCMEYVPEEYAPAIYSELAFIYALRGNGTKAEGFIKRLEEGREKSVESFRARLAYALLTGRTEEKRDLYEQAKEELKYALPGMKKFERKMMKRIFEPVAVNS